ncbi:tyrosine-protein phosphatase [Solibacillus sp. FSL K6-1523]|uniref:tyrosine-protein phosphatase n=1 Tax=Solibacillus sp. FSL K6-1523 TaxID=2921471 RepID=UPI0030FC25D6
MVDTHSHLLWNVDDGPKNKEQALRVVEQVLKAGITDIIATSHFMHPQFHVDVATTTKGIQQLQEELKKNQLPLKIHTGHEVRLHDKLLSYYSMQQIFTLANSSYLLIELPSYSVPHFTIKIIQLLLEKGIIPIIAHPERNKVFQENPTKLEQLVHAGATTQLTAGSLTGQFGRTVQKFALNLVRANLVHTYGSDVHNDSTRPFLFNEGLFYLEKKKEGEAVDLLLENNSRILKNEPFIYYEPEKIESTKWWKII